MSFSRLLKYINIILGATLAGMALLVYWYAWRPLPQTSGAISEFLNQPVTVSRDSLGAPHIVAQNESDLLFVQGYVTAQDRLWQLEGLRRLASGELAEIFGPSALELDKESRRLGMRHIAERAYVTLSAKDRAALAAYARGVSAFIASHRNRLPVEFTLLGCEPRPWSVVDSILTGLQMFRTLTSTWRYEMQKQALLAGGNASKVNFLFPPRSGAEPQLGSNAWAISGRLTASGRPLLANDPHLEFSIPGIWYAVHLKAPELNVIGVSLPGLPGVIIGHNERIGWGITNLQFDVQDLYIEQFDDKTGRYQFQGKPEQAIPERELIRVRGAAPVEATGWMLRHGPLFLMEENQRLSLRWVAAEAEAFQFPFLDIDRARTWREFTVALARFAGPGSNFVYADIDGNIGYHAAGKLPIRKTHGGDVPVDGASGNFEWQGFIPFEQLPSIYNPASGIIVTANQNPFPPDYPYAVSGNFAPPDRSNQIRSLLLARKNWRAEQMLAVQKDVYSAFSHFLARAIVAACDRRKVSQPNLLDAVQILRRWNGQMEKGQPAPLLVTLAFQHVRRAVADCASPGNGVAYDFPMSTAVIEHLLRTRPKGWFADYDQMLVKNFAEAVEEGQRMQGRNVNRWSYGRYLEWTLAHRVGHNLPLVGKYFDIGPVPMSGSSTTVKQTTQRLGPSMRMVVDFADFDNSLLNLLTGESGQVLSRHYKDQWEHYYMGRSFPMQFTAVKAESVLKFVPK